MQEVSRPGTLLTDAIRVESVELVEYLLAHGVNPNASGWLDSNPLLDSIVSGNADLVQMLLKHGADVTVKNHIGQGVLQVAEEYRAGSEISKALEAYGAIRE